MSKPILLERYREFLPLTSATPLLTLGEGDTPLVCAPSLARSTGCAAVYLKLEGCNPTGSFKDRGMVVAVAKAVEMKAAAVVCASTGNTSASAAAYARRSGLEPIVIIPKGKIAIAKFAQALIYGARVLEVNGNFDDALCMVRELTKHHPITLVNSVNPHRIEGQKTAAFEICDDLGCAPDYLCLPVGNAGNITAYWRGFVEYYRAGRSPNLPRMCGFQAEGAAPIVHNQAVANPQTIASAIRIGNPASWHYAVTARDESGGVIEAVSDTQMLAAYHLIAQEEGVFAEPASAASVAGLLQMAQQNKIRPGSIAVCVLTGNGLKDPGIAVEGAAPTLEVTPDLEAIERALGLVPAVH